MPMGDPLPCAHGGPVISGRMKLEPDDFVVEEIPGFEPSGSGEHAWLWVEKRGANTDWVAGQLARFAGVAPSVVGFAGLKDRHAVTRQVFTLQLPGQVDPDWNTLAVPGVRVLSATRHSRKLKRGALRGNRFRIRLREVRGDCEQVPERLDRIAASGVPNYFGEQRFGRDGGNLDLARALFNGRRLGRAQRGFALSAARAEIFNAILAARVASGTWDQALEGEVWMLDGSHSVFGPEPASDALMDRLRSGDIHSTGPMWGRGELRSADAVRALELGVAELHSDLAGGLEAAGLDYERRSLRLPVRGLEWNWEGGDFLVVSFELGAGSFATAVLRELCDWSE